MFDKEIKRTENGFIDKDQILEYVSEEDIYELVFGFKPQEFDFVVSPFRNDTRPGCFFQYATNGKLRFTDFGNPNTIGNINMNNIDCFDAVQVYFKLPSYYASLKFVKDTLINGKELPPREIKSTIQKSVVKKEVKFLVEPKILTIQDKNFWQDRYQITRENLLEDKVLTLRKFRMINTKFGDCDYSCKTPTYCYTDFKSKHVKLYRPFEKKRFLTNCVANDIGGTRYLSDNKSKTLVITKSYKDWRVLKNQGVNCIWFQNEGMIPDLEVLIPICFMYDKIIVLFDNDTTGINASKKVAEIINNALPGKAEYLFLPLWLANLGISDPADLIHKQGRTELLNYLKTRNII